MALSGLMQLWFTPLCTNRDGEIILDSSVNKSFPVCQSVFRQGEKKTCLQVFTHVTQRTMYTGSD